MNFPAIPNTLTWLDIGSSMALITGVRLMNGTDASGKKRHFCMQTPSMQATLRTGTTIFHFARQYSRQWMEISMATATIYSGPDINSINHARPVKQALH
jgi:hypothetical protein